MHRPAAAAALGLLLTFAGAGLAASPRERPTVVVEVHGGFHWLDAGVGAVSMLALLALVYGALLLRRTAGRPRSEGRSDV